MIKLIKSTFFNEAESKDLLCKFIIDTKFLSMGEQCKDFEINFSKKQGRKYSVFVNSGSSANLILIQALLNLGRLKKGDSVALSSLTWATNVMPIIQLGLTPIFLDCELDNLNVSSAIFRQALKNFDIKCLFITNALGLCADLDEISLLCKDKGIILLEDNCESLGSIAFNKNLGNFGLASTFSFFVGHHISTIEGGIVVTDDFSIFEQLLMVRAHGWDRSLCDKSKRNLRELHNIDNFYSQYMFYDLAYNLRPTEINGFLGNLQIQYWDKIVKERQKNFLFLNNLIIDNKNLISINHAHIDTLSSFAIPVIVKDNFDINIYKKRCIDLNVEFRPMIAGNIANQPFVKKYFSIDYSLPNAEYLHKNSFYFGNHPELTGNELSILSGIIS